MQKIMNNCTTDMNDFITKEIKFKDGGFAKVVITERKYDAKNKEDIKVVFDECGLNYENMTDCKQIHSDIVRIIKKDDIGVTEEADAMITDIPSENYKKRRHRCNRGSRCNDNRYSSDTSYDIHSRLCSDSFGGYK